MDLWTEVYFFVLKEESKRLWLEVKVWRRGFIRWKVRKEVGEIKLFGEEEDRAAKGNALLVSVIIIFNKTLSRTLNK